MILAIVGPTGVGKTRMSVELAKRYNGIIINCDAMQVYKGLDIGTAKIREEEKEGILHYLFDFVDVRDNYTVYDYQKDVRALLDRFADRNIIFVGGTGLYLRAALYDYRFNEEDEKVVDESLSNDELYQLCLQKDPNCSIHKNNRKRMIRFLKRGLEPPVNPVLLYPTIFIGLTTDRDHLYQIINQRVDKMIAEGLIEEAKSFFVQKIYSKALMTGIGYKELYSYFEGKCSLEESIDLIKKNSRHYAKRQYTFFRHQLPVQWFDVNYDHFEKTVAEVDQFIIKTNNKF